jgi:hypothetical protein
MPWYGQAILAVAAALAALLVFVRPFGRWALRVDLRWLVAIHLVRFVGFYFLYLYSHGELPFRFAVWGGWGDISVSLLAIAVVVFAYRNKFAVAAWNVLGLADILAVAITASRSELAVPGSMHQLDRLPLVLLPTFIVPVIIVTHVLMLLRVFRQKELRSEGGTTWQKSPV